MRVPRAGWIVALVLAAAVLLLIEGVAPLGGEPPALTWVQPREPVSPGYRLLEHLGDMNVLLERGGKKVPFRLKRGTFRGPKDLPKWIWVGPVQVDLPLLDDPVWEAAVPQANGKAETLCIWAHPTDTGKLVLTWSDVPPGALHGLLYFLPAADDKAASRIRILWNGKQVSDLVPPTRHGKSVLFQTTLRVAGTDAGELRIEVETRTKGKNHLCLDGWIVPIPDSTPTEEPASEAEIPRSDLDVMDAQDQDVRSPDDPEGDVK